jgi:hypothetical protein
MRFLPTLTAFLATSYLPMQANAYDDYYKCSLAGVAETWNNTETIDYWLDAFMKEEIFVDRRTGEVRHIGLGNSYYDEIALLHSGDSENSFKVLAKSHNGQHAHFMTVQTFAESEDKKFIVVAGGTVWNGSCK